MKTETKIKLGQWMISGLLKKGNNIQKIIFIKAVNKEVEKMRGSWQTSISGICTILVALGNAVMLLVDGNPNTNPDLAATIAAITAGIGLLRARDNDKSSEDVGAK